MMASQDWGVSAARRSQAGIARLHHTDPAESNRASEIGPFALENKKLHPLKLISKKRRQIYHKKLQHIGKHL